MTKFELQTWVDQKVAPLVTPLIGSDEWSPWRTSMLSAIVKDTAYGKGKVMEVLQRNPVSCQLALVKCAKLGLSPEPQLEHFALVPRGAAIEGEVMWRGWQHIMLQSGAVEWIDADVIYKAEYDAMSKAGVPLRDPHSNRINAPDFCDEVARDQWADKDVVASYCMVKLIGRPRLVAVVLTRKELDKRRSLAQTDKVWAAHYVSMCKAKAIKAVGRQGQVPLTVSVAQAMAEAESDLEGATVQVAAAAPVEDVSLPPAGAMVGSATEVVPITPVVTVEPAVEQDAPASDPLFDQLNQNPLPSDDERVEMLRTVLAQEAMNRDYSDSDLVEIAQRELSNATIESIDELDDAGIEAVIEAVRK